MASSASDRDQATPVDQVPSQGLRRSSRHIKAAPGGEHPKTASDGDEDGDSQDEGSDGEDDEDEEGDYEDEDEEEEYPRPAPVEIELLPLEQRLVPPPEVMLNILGQLGRRYASRSDPDRDWLWLEGRLVCHAWRDWIEARAREEWMASARFTSTGGMVRTATGKLMISTSLEFSHFEGDDLAVFEEKECAPEYLQIIQSHFNRVKVLDAHFGGFIHDIPITGMQCSTTSLRLTVPYKHVVSQLCSEERKMDRHFEAFVLPQIYARAAESKLAVDRGEMDVMAQMMEAMNMFGDGRFGAYVAVRKARRGRADPPGDERLKQMRFYQSFEGLDDDEEGAGNGSDEDSS